MRHDLGPGYGDEALLVVPLLIGDKVRLNIVAYPTSEFAEHDLRSLLSTGLPYSYALIVDGEIVESEATLSYKKCEG